MLDEVYVVCTCQSFFGTAPSAYQSVPENPSFNMLKVLRFSLSHVHHIFFRIDKINDFGDLKSLDNLETCNNACEGFRRPKETNGVLVRVKKINLKQALHGSL